MLKNYLLVAVRHLMKKKLFSAINILGLAVGMAACILMILFVREEISYDRSFTNVDNIYRVHASLFMRERTPLKLATGPAKAVGRLEAELDDVTKSTFVYNWRTSIEANGEKRPTTVVWAGPSFFDLFDFKVEGGDPQQILTKPRAAIIHPDLAKELFADKNPIGKTLLLADGREITVAGLLASPVPNSHISTKLFISLASLEEDKRLEEMTSWSNFYASTYFELAEGGSLERVQEKLDQLVGEHIPPISRLGTNIRGNDWLSLSIIPVRDIYLKSDRTEEMVPLGDVTLVYTFSVLSVLILIVACINFTNLATARAGDRAREIGMRKLVGALRRQVILQILGESIFLSLFALILAVATVEFALPFYNEVIGKTLSLDYGRDLGLLGGLLALAIGVGFLGGIYPATFLSAFRPLAVLRGPFADLDGRFLLRSILVVIQFAISIGLMIATIVVYSQMVYAKSQLLQFDREHAMTLSSKEKWDDSSHSEKMRAIAYQLLALGEVTALTMSSASPPEPFPENAVVKRPNYDAGYPQIMRQANIDHKFFDTFGVEILKGRNFNTDISRDYFDLPTDEQPVTFSNAILNESAVEWLGFESAEAAIGQTVQKGLKAPNYIANHKIIGVVRDANFASARHPVEPTMFYMEPNRYQAMSFTVTGDDVWATKKKIKQIWWSNMGNKDYTLRFIDAGYDELYKQETTRSYLFGGFSVLAMIIACLGLFGLASISAEKRTQEIGLRKVMGASVTDIVKLLVWQFTRPVIVANLIAWPIAYLTMQAWLDGFAYHITLSPLAFVAASVITCIVAWSTVALHARRVAMTKPAQTLRYE